MVPRAGEDGEVPVLADGSPAPTWVFPFNRPAAPEEGDNQALAVNTEDGSTVYDVAFALVWADGNQVLNTNEAYAFASCTDCQTVAVGFQVILITGEANVIVPQNLSGAVNYNCVECVTYALATQLVLTLDGPLSEASTAELAALWEEIAAFGTDIEDVPLSELQRSLTDFEIRILEIVQNDPAAVPADEESTQDPSASPTGSGDKTDGPASTGTATTSPDPSSSETSGSSPSGSETSSPSGTRSSSTTSPSSSSTTSAP